MKKFFSKKFSGNKFVDVRVVVLIETQCLHICISVKKMKKNSNFLNISTHTESTGTCLLISLCLERLSLKAVACCSQFEYRRNKEEGGYVVRVDLGGDKAEASTLSLINFAQQKI